MTMLSSDFKDIVEPVLNTLFDGLYDREEKEWKKAGFTIENGIKRRKQEDVVIGGLGVSVEKGENANVSYSAGSQAYRKEYVFRTFALAFKISQEMMEDGEHASFAKIFTEHLAHSMAEGEELFHANIFNQAFNNAYKGGDGVSLLNTAHPLAGGGQFSNVLATPADLSEAALEELRAMIRNAVDERGKPISIKAKKLIIPTSEYMNALRITQSDLRPGVNTNDINALKFSGFIDEIVELTRLVDQDAFFITTNVKRGLMHIDRMKLATNMEGDFESGSMRYKARQRFDAGWTDPRGVYGSSGAI